MLAPWASGKEIVNQAEKEKFRLSLPRTLKGKRSEENETTKKSNSGYGFENNPQIEKRGEGL